MKTTIVLLFLSYGGFVFGGEYEGEPEAAMVEKLSEDEINEIIKLLEDEVNRINATTIRILDPDERLGPVQDLLDEQADR